MNYYKSEDLPSFKLSTECKFLCLKKKFQTGTKSVDSLAKFTWANDNSLAKEKQISRALNSKWWKLINQIRPRGKGQKALKFEIV